MRNIKKIVKKQRAKRQARAPAAGGPNEGNKIEVLTKEIKENRKALEASAVKKGAAEAAKKQKEKAAIEAKAAKEKEESELFPVQTTKPIIPTHGPCPICGEEKTIRGMSRHIKAKHPEDLEDPDDVEDPEDQEGLEDLEDPESLKDPEKEAKENGAGGVLSLIFIIGIPAAIILSRIPKFKEIGDKLLAILGGLGSEESPGSKDPRLIDPSRQGGFNQRR